MKLEAFTISTEIQSSRPEIAVLPIGSFEQHGEHLPLATDAIIATAIAGRCAEAYGMLELPPVTIACSHEHEDFPGTVSISATTLAGIVIDVQTSLRRAGIEQVILINAHGGNYVLSNCVQQANAVDRGSMGLFPRRDDWELARTSAHLESSHSEDMHGGELETSIMMHLNPAMVRDSYSTSDHESPTRPNLLVGGIGEYTESGIIGFPSLASKEKGSLILNSLVSSFGNFIKDLQLYRSNP